jgi:hypothetical protein
VAMLKKISGLFISYVFDIVPGSWSGEQVPCLLKWYYACRVLFIRDSIYGIKLR